MKAAFFGAIGHHPHEILPGGIVHHGKIAPVIMQLATLIPHEDANRVPEDIREAAHAIQIRPDPGGITVVDLLSRCVFPVIDLRAGADITDAARKGSCDRY